MPARPRIVLKLGGELLEQRADLTRVTRGIANLARRSALVVVHGGGREIDAALTSAGIPKRQVDGIRITDARTLQVVVAVLAGGVNTRLVAAVRRAGCAAGGPDGRRCIGGDPQTGEAYGQCRRPQGPTWGLVGQPVADGVSTLLVDLIERAYVPIVACIGSDARWGAAQRQCRHAGVASCRATRSQAAGHRGGHGGCRGRARQHDRDGDSTVCGTTDSGGYGEQGHGREAGSPAGPRFVVEWETS